MHDKIEWLQRNYKTLTLEQKTELFILESKVRESRRK